MATILPFKAVRPSRDKVSLIASRSYQSYTETERKARLDHNPYSFLHIVNPGYKYQKEIDGKERFELVRNRYQEFKEDHSFVKDKKKSLYIYKIIDREKQVFIGIIGASSVSEYEDNTIKKHEDTIEYRELLFKEYLKTVGFNAEPVLLTYKDNATINTVMGNVMKERPEYEFTTTYRDTHYLWPITGDDDIATITTEFSKIPTLYIADGHHRSASSVLLAKDLKSEDNSYTGKEPYNFFMSYYISESSLKIYQFNRLVKDLNGLSKQEFLIKLDMVFRIEDRGTMLYRPKKKHYFSMYLDGHFYSLSLRKQYRNFKTPLEALGSQIIYDTILKPILGIEDLRNDHRIAYIDGKNDDMVDVKNAIDAKTYQVGFGMLPISIQELKAVADANLKMPPKSTYIEPKLRSGLCIYEF